MSVREERAINLVYEGPEGRGSLLLQEVYSKEFDCFLVRIKINDGDCFECHTDGLTVIIGWLQKLADREE